MEKNFYDGCFVGTKNIYNPRVYKTYLTLEYMVIDNYQIERTSITNSTQIKYKNWPLKF